MSVSIMKRHYIYWLIIILVFVSSFGVFYVYRKYAKENPLVEDANLDDSRHYIGENGVAQSDILVLNYDIPTVYAEGKILEYQFVKNPQTNENELYVKLFTEQKVLPVRIDYISTSGTTKKGDFIVKDIGSSERADAEKILKEGKSGLPLVESNYVILFSIQGREQQKLCQNFIGSALGDRWCEFDPNKKSYTREELLKQLLKALKVNSQSTIGNIRFPEYFFLEGNASMTLQVNYRVDENLIKSLK